MPISPGNLLELAHAEQSVFKATCFSHVFNIYLSFFQTYFFACFSRPSVNDDRESDTDRLINDSGTFQRQVDAAVRTIRQIDIPSER